MSNLKQTLHKDMKLNCKNNEIDHKLANQICIFELGMFRTTPFGPIRSLTYGNCGQWRNSMPLDWTL